MLVDFSVVVIERRPPGRPRSTWLRVIDEDVQPQNFGVHKAWRKANDRDTWHQVVSMATLLEVRHQEEEEQHSSHTDIVSAFHVLLICH